MKELNYAAGDDSPDISGIYLGACDAVILLPGCMRVPLSALACRVQYRACLIYRQTRRRPSIKTDALVP
jgi:hypothetical protein